MKTVLFIHGLSAKKRDNEYFISYMQKKRNINMYSFTLPGHENDKMSKVKYTAWLEESEQQLKKIIKKHKKVTIVAHSMGTIIAVNLASKYKEVDKLVLISPAFIYGNIEQNKKDFKNLLKHNVDDELGTGFEGALRKFIEVPKSVWNEYKKMAKENIPNISKVKCPTLIIYGKYDNLISYEAIKTVYDNLSGKKDILLVDRVRHQVFKSYKKDLISRYIYRYITHTLLYKIKRKQLI